MELKAIYFTLAFSVMIILAMCYVCSCTYSVTLVHTQGMATDVVDETATNSPRTTATPKLTIPTAIL